MSEWTSRGCPPDSWDRAPVETAPDWPVEAPPDGAWLGGPLQDETAWGDWPEPVLIDFTPCPCPGESFYRGIAPDPLDVATTIAAGGGFTGDLIPELVSVFVTTAAYPIEIVDATSPGADVAFDGFLMGTDVDGSGMVAALPFTGIMTQTSFWHYVTAGTGAEHTDIDNTGMVAALPFSGTLTQTVFWHSVTAGTGAEHTDIDNTGMVAASPFFGTLTQTVFWLYIQAGIGAPRQDYSDSGVFPGAGFTGTLTGP